MEISIANMAMDSSQMNLAVAVSTDVTKMALDSEKQISQQITQMLSQPQDPNLGRFLDVTV